MGEADFCAESSIPTTMKQYRMSSISNTILLENVLEMKDVPDFHGNFFFQDHLGWKAEMGIEDGESVKSRGLSPSLLCTY
ncbi:hypothetical protein SLA2020_023420 [Shorea laevis]